MWRGILIFLAVLWTLSAVAGVWLGQALTDSAPLRLDDGTTPTLSAAAGQVLAGAPQPPQPRVDGTLGVPDRDILLSLEAIPLVSALENTASSVSMSTVVVERSTADPAAILAGRGSGSAGGRATGENDMAIPGLNAMLGDMPGAHQPAAPPPPPPPSQAVSSGPDWLSQLRAGLNACVEQREFSQPECEQRQRQRYCGANGGWGAVAECPSYLRNLRM